MEWSLTSSLTSIALILAIFWVGNLIYKLTGNGDPLEIGAALYVIIVAFAMIYEIGSAIIPAAYNHPILTIIIIALCWYKFKS